MDPWSQQWMQGLANVTSALGGVLQWCPQCRGRSAGDDCPTCTKLFDATCAVLVVRDLAIITAQKEVQGAKVILPAGGAPGR